MTEGIDLVFQQAIDAWVNEAHAQGIRSFSELVRALPGVYPTEVMCSLERQQLELIQTQCLRQAKTLQMSNWPVEHPLDFDWRFTLDSTRLLLDKCECNGPLTFLGAPSLVHEAAERGYSSVSLYDVNPVVVAAVREAFPWVATACVDLVYGTPVRGGEAAITIADPPWYPEHAVAFLWAASRQTHVGGRVFLSLPSPGTRPGICAERVAVLAKASTFGLRLASTESGLLRYSMPPFERNALAAANVPVVDHDWRCGDLLEFVVEEKGITNRLSPIEKLQGWEEEFVGAVRIKCRRCSNQEFLDPTLSPAVKGAILASVSRRHPERAAADVWTSGNRIFQCTGSAIFRVIVSAIKYGNDVVHDVGAVVRRNLLPAEIALVRRASAQAQDLICCEERELAENGYRCRKRDLAEAV
jgi:hypothetical protein